VSFLSFYAFEETCIVILALKLSFFSFIRRRNICLGTFWGLFCTLGSCYSTICIETCEYYRAASPWELFCLFFLLSGFIFLFYWILESSLLVLSCKVRSISFGVLGSIFFKGVLDLSVYLRDGSTPTSPAQGPSSRVIWNSLLRICCSQIAEVTTDPNLIVWARAFLHELPGFLTSGPWGGTASLLNFYFSLSFVFCGQFNFLSSAFSFLPIFLFFQHPQEGELLKRHGSLGIWVSSIPW